MTSNKFVWKEFLKLNRSKIILFILLFLSLPLIFEYSYDFSSGSYCLISLWTGLGFLSRVILTCCEGALYFILEHIYGILAGLIVSYLLSVTIFYFLKTRQNIVDFIKPTKKKIIITFLIFLIAPIWGFGLSPYSSIHICPTHLTFSSPEFPYGIGIIVLGEVIFSPITHNYGELENLILPLQIFILYFLSCAAAHYYEKSKKIKDFVRVKWRKVGLVITLFVCFSILWYIQFVSELPLNRPYFQLCLSSLIAILYWPISALHHFFPSLIGTSSITWYDMILLIFYWYFLSCFIFFLYDNFKARDEKNVCT